MLTNAILKWLNDGNRMEKLQKAKLTGELFYLDEKKIDENDFKMFENTSIFDK